ncbi:MAG: enoyl-CoA hydratase/isomerase family protein [Pseudooceanicola sp.]
MSSDIHIRKEGHAGRITLTRPKALNALTYDMAMAIDNALSDWSDDPSVALIIIDAQGDKAFCSGGDIEELYNRGRAGDFAFGQAFWRDEYRLNARLAEYAKPIVSFLQGFVMGGGVGIGCLVRHRVVGETAQIAMPECGIGLVPDVGGSLLLARAPGRLGEYLGLTAARMGPGDAIYAGFADTYIAEDNWPEVKGLLCKTGSVDALITAATPAPPPILAPTLAPTLAQHQDRIDAVFSAPSLGAIVAALAADTSEFGTAAGKAISRNSPLSMACALAMITKLRDTRADMRAALAQEYRFTARAMEHGDFLEGIRAQIIDRDRNPQWRYALGDVTSAHVATMLAPLGPLELTF